MIWNVTQQEKEDAHFFMQMHMQKFSPPKFKACLPNHEFSVLVTSHPCAQSVNTSPSPSLQNVGKCVYVYLYIRIHIYIYIHNHLYMYKYIWCLYIYICEQIDPCSGCINASRLVTKYLCVLFVQRLKDGYQQRRARLFYLLGTWANMALAVKSVEIRLGGYLTL
jgi:hypothetical protein